MRERCFFREVCPAGNEHQTQQFVSMVCPADAEYYPLMASMVCPADVQYGVPC